MASQRVLILTIGGLLAESVWKHVRRWGDARTVTEPGELSAEQWPAEIRDQIDAFVDKLSSDAIVPPVLYRSEHVDCWSMGDVYQEALVKADRDYSCQLCTDRFELIVTRVRFTEQIIVDEGAPPETVWFYNRVNEAISAWGELAEHRLIVLVRQVLGGLWEDHEVEESLMAVPDWWAETERRIGQA